MVRKLKPELSHKFKKLDIFTRRLVSTKLVGKYKTLIRGKGLEFNGFREYTFEDDASLIDWKATVRLRKPYIKEFIEERNLEVFFLIDVSATMVFGSTQKLKNEYVIELVSLLSYAVLNAGDSLGYAFFADKPFNINLPSHNQKLFYILTNQLINADLYGGNYDFEAALKKITPLLKKNSILIIISDFIGLFGDWQKEIKQASYKFDTIGIMVRDPRDKEIPEDSEMIIISDPYTNEQIILDPTKKVRERYKVYVEHQEKNIKDVFIKSRASFLRLSTDQNPIPLIINFFTKRKKWLR